MDRLVVLEPQDPQEPQVVGSKQDGFDVGIFKYDYPIIVCLELLHKRVCKSNFASTKINNCFTYE